MAIAVTLQNILAGFNLSKLNANFTAIETALADGLSRSGNGSNAMSADIDLDSNDLLNGGAGNFDTIIVDGTDLTQSFVDLAADIAASEANATAAALSAAEAAASAVSSAADVVSTNADVVLTNADVVTTAANAAASVAAKMVWQGDWLTATAYALSDVVEEDGSSYICIVAHTSGTFAADLAAVKWELVAQKGADGAGSGDLISTNNLSDLDNVATARTNLDVYDKATVDLKAPLASPALTGSPTAPTQTASDNSTKIATTAYTDAAVAAVGGGDEWGSQPIGVPIPVWGHITGVSAPPTDQSYRYVLLTAGEDGVGGYNEGLVANEIVSGSDPDIVATFDIDDAESPMYGETVRLLNTTREFLRPGSAGTIQDNALKAHVHNNTTRGGNAYSGVQGIFSTTWGTVATSSVNTQSTGDTETRPRNMGVTVYLRIK